MLGIFKQIDTISFRHFVIFVILLCGILYVTPTWTIKCICSLAIFYVYFLILTKNYYLQIFLEISKHYWIKIKYVIFPNDKFSDIPNGLENNGNTCYMNSIIQMLASSDKTIRQLENINTNINNPTLEMLIDLLHDLNNPNCSSKENTRKLCSLIKNINWTKAGQQDPVDLLSSIIKSIQDKIPSDLDKEKLQVVLKYKILHKYSGIDIPQKIQDHLGLQLGLFGNYRVYPGVTIEDLIANYFSNCYIDEDINKTSRVYFYKKAPDVLLLHIQANKWNSESAEMIKPTYYIQYNKDLQLTLDIADIDKIIKDVKVGYKLRAIVHHMGTISGGHYVTYREYQNEWYILNDEDVRAVKFNCDVCPYILLYEKEPYQKIVL